MTTKSLSEPNFDHSNIYQIRVKGHLDIEWSDWFDGLTIRLCEDDTTLITGPVIDDAALHGLLKKVRDSGMRLLSVNIVEADQADIVENEQSEPDGDCQQSEN